MNEQLLVDALTRDEELAPDPADVLAGLAVGIRRRRRRRVAGYAAVLTVLMVAGAATVPLLRDRDRQPTAGPVLAAAFERTIQFGWLPEYLEPAVSPVVNSALYSASTTGESAQFQATGGYVSLEVSTFDFQPRLDHPGWRPVQVAGRPGRLASQPTRTYIGWRLPSGRWASLQYGIWTLTGSNGQPGVEADAERIAAGITEGDPVPVRLAFGLTHLPPGMRIVGVHSVSGDNGYGMLSVTSGPWEVVGTVEAHLPGDLTADQPDLAAVDQLIVSFESESWEPGPGDKRVGTVHGQPAYLLSQGRGLAFDWPPYGSVQIRPAGNDEVMSADEYLAVARGTRRLSR